MKKILSVLVIIPLFISVYCFEGNKTKKNPEITAREVQEHINFLASDELKGRFTGSEGAIKASDYIKDEFESYGLTPFFAGSYFQEFPFISGVELAGDNSFSLLSNGADRDLKLNEEYIPAHFSDNLSVKGELVFAGYGISATDLNYDDYEGIDVNGKIVIALRFNPDVENPHSKFDRYSDLRMKAKIAKEKGAIGIVFANGYIPKDDEDKLMKLRYDGAPAIKSIAAVQVKRNILDEIFKLEGKNFKEYQAKINETKKPASFIVKNVSVSFNTDVKKVEKTGRNVACWIEGSDPKLKNEYVVIGAHYDHLGMGETGSLYKGSEPQIHNGADDNASGTAGVMELAEKFSELKGKLKRSIVFVAFAGEELGLLGSNYFVQNLAIPLKDISAMLNLDMIGRMNDENNLIVNGAGTSKLWKDLLNKLNGSYNFKLSLVDDGYGGSDQESFVIKDVPVLFFFTGIHNDYHRPTDDADKIKSDKEEKILKYISQIADFVDTTSSRPDYVKVERKKSSMGFKVYVGTVPDYTAQTEGFKITGVSEGSPAQKAGLKGGDIIVNFGGKKVNDIYDYMNALGEFVPGDVVDVVVKRGGENVNLKITLTAK